MFVDNIRNAWKWLSIQFLALAIAAQVAWEALPPDVVAIIPEEWRGKIVLVLTIIGLIGRLIKQEPKP